MNNTTASILQNFRGLFGQYKTTTVKNGQQVSITCDGSTVTVQEPRAITTSSSMALR